jgi:flagellar hook assembly protein FlgD
MNNKWILLNSSKIKDERWKLIPDTNFQLSSSIFQLDPELNTISAQINQFGTYSVMLVSTDPKLKNVIVYPNPYTDDTKFVFTLDSESDIKICIYTITGRLIKTITKQVSLSEIGTVQIVYDGTDDQKQPVSNGTYIYKIWSKNNTGTFTHTGKITKIK